MKITEKEVLERLNAIINDAIALAIDMEFGSEEEYLKNAMKTYTNIPLPETDIPLPKTDIPLLENNDKY